REATASAVVADVMDVALNRRFDSHHRVAAFQPHQGYENIVPMSEVRTRYYLRLQALDQPGVLASVSGILGRRSISIASMTQKEGNQVSVPMVILTHQAREADMQAALAEIRELDEIAGNPMMIRIEDL
ncbi:MAG: ACT domain-containing protein, partial [Lentisphaeria bacterium]|nr:ACT domain-containing protein [Lentisphaeria bacterium]